MPRNLIIAGVCAEVAAATVGCALGFAMRARGTRVGVMKPVETGCAERDGALEPAGARALAFASSCNLPIDLICPHTYRSTLAPPLAAEADGAAQPDFARILECFRGIASECDAVIVDAAGGITIPITHQADYADLAAALGLEVVMVVASDRAALDDGVLAARHALSRRLRFAGYVLADTKLAASPPDTSGSDDNGDAAFALERLTGVRYLGRMRFREPLSKAIIERLL
ncbi:MAG TPA: AAA family ATPase [Candidatus Binataceae bacterium]